MEWLNKGSPFFELLQESRALFAVELAKNLTVLSVSKGYFRGLGDLYHDPVGMKFKKIAGGNPKSFEQIRLVAKEKLQSAAVAFTMHPPFPMPRNVRGQALAGGNASVTLLLEREIGAFLELTPDTVITRPTRVSISHADLFRAYEEMSGLRQSLSTAEERLQAFELEIRFRGMYVKLLTRIAENARELASLAIIMSTRLESTSINRAQLQKLEETGIEVSESAMRLARALK